MSTVTVITRIHAPIERCFDLTRSMDFHVHSMSTLGETAIAGVTSGLIGMGQEVTWRARHFGLWQTLTSRITAYDRPHHFRDSMVQGSFKSFDHDHYFRRLDKDTVMEDAFEFTSPLGLLGKLADAVFLKVYMKRLLTSRAQQIKQAAESDSWRAFVDT